MVREGLTREEATRRFYPLGRTGLLIDDRAAHMYDFQLPYARPAAEVAGWAAGRRASDWPRSSRTCIRRS